MNRFIYWFGLSFLFATTNLFTVAQEVDGGNSHSIILDEYGQVWTIGRNDHGQLGNGSYENSSIPVLVEGLPLIKSIARGYDHTMALDEAGNLWVWGRNNYGQLGIETFEDILSPIKPGGFDDFVALEGGYWHSIALKSDGSVWSWGHNYYGELGSTNREHNHWRQPVMSRSDESQKAFPLASIASIKSVGYHTLALDSHGQIWSWGDNTSYQLGHQTLIVQPYATKVEGIPTMRSIATGWHHSLALDSSGSIWIWGTDQSMKETPETKFIKSPTRLVDLPEMSQIACGSWHSMSIDINGQVWTWGGNKVGMLGSGDSIAASQPQKVIGMNQAYKIGAGCFQSLVLDSNGVVWSFGDNFCGQLGLSNHEKQFTAQKTLLSTKVGIDSSRIEILRNNELDEASISPKTYSWPTNIFLIASLILNLILLIVLSRILSKNR